MKRIILIFSLVVTFLGILITASPYLLRLTGLDEPVKKYIFSRIIKDSEGRLDIQKFKIGLGKLHFANVSIESQNSNFKLLIRSIDIGINPFAFITHPTEPQQAVKSVYMFEPRLIITKTENANVNETDTTKNLSGDEQLTQLLKTLNQLQTIERISIEDGRIIWKNQKGRYLSLVKSLNGWLNVHDLDNIVAETRGCLLASKDENFRLSANINLGEKTFDAVTEFNDANLEETVFPFIPENIHIQSGSTTAKLLFRNRSFIVDSTQLNGRITAQNFYASIDSNYIENLRFQVDFKNRAMSINNASGFFYNQLFSIEGSIKDIINPRLKLRFTADNFSLSPFSKFIGGNIFNDSRVNILADFQYGGLNPLLTAQIRSPALSLYGNQYISDFNTTISLEKGSLFFRKIAGDFGGLALEGSGNYNIDGHDLKMSLSGIHKFGQHKVFDRLSDKEQRFSANLNLNFRTNFAYGNWKYTLTSLDDSLFNFNGKIRSVNNHLKINLIESNIPNLQARLQINDFLSNPKIKKARLINFPFDRLSTDPFFTKPLNRFSTDISLDGSLDRLNGNAIVIDRTNIHNDFRLNAVFTKLLSDQKEVKGSVELKRLIGFYDISFKNDFLQGNFHFPEGIDGDLSLDLSTSERLAASVKFDKFNIIRVFTDSLLQDEFHLLGQINGEIIVGGELRDPQLQAYLFGDKFVFNDIGYYQAELQISANQDSVIFDSVEVSLNNLPLIAGKGDWYPETKKLKAVLSGQQINVENISSTFSSGKPLMTGIASIEASIDGDPASPRIEAVVRITEGTIKDLSFDELNLKIVDVLSKDGKIYDLKDHNLVVHNLYLAKKGRYHFSGDGILPLNKSGEIDLSLNFDGDLLSFIPYWEPFFVSGASLASLKVKVGGTQKQLQIKSGLLEIDRGELTLKDVVPDIHSISGKIEKKEGTNQINIINLKSSSEEGSLTLNTVRDIKKSTGKYFDHWYFKNLDLDFGILALSTSEKGVELSIPGLMITGETGKLNLSGASVKTPFYLAGPVKHPQAAGIISLYNIRLTYPFLIEGESGKEPSPAVQFLSEIDWDVLIKSGEDVQYFRQLPAYIDNVDMEIYVDEKSDGLKFTGIISKGTFKPVGQLTSSRGRLDYLDQIFQVDHFAIEFNEYEDLPVISGRAWTTIRDSIGAAPKTIYLQLYAIDEATGLEKEQGGWEQFKFRLVSADPQIGETQEQVLAYMGFSVGNIKDKATSVGGAVTEKYLIRPLLRPIERALERNLGIDLVRINSNIAKNLFYSTLGTEQEYGNGSYINPFTTNAPYLFLMQSSEVTVGKYLSQDLYLTYTGQLVSVYNEDKSGFGFNHSIGLEYRFPANVLLRFEYDRELMGYYRFNQSRYLEDFKIRLRHSFSF